MRTATEILKGEQTFKLYHAAYRCKAFEQRDFTSLTMVEAEPRTDGVHRTVYLALQHIEDLSIGGILMGKHLIALGNILAYNTFGEVQALAERPLAIANQMKPKLMSLKEFAVHIGVSYSTVRRMVANKSIRVVMPHRRAMIPASEAVKYSSSAKKSVLPSAGDGPQENGVAYNC